MNLTANPVLEDEDGHQQGGQAESCALLRASVHRPMNPERMRRLAAEVTDWDCLIKAAREHRIAPMLHDCVLKLELAIPPEAAESLRLEYDRNAYQGLANAAELIALLEEFSRHQIPAMPFKGVVLGASVYGGLTTRPAGDLDILIHHRHLKRATEILLRRGYQLSTPTNEDGSPAAAECYEYEFERPIDGLIVELRWRLELFQPQFRQEVGLDWAWPRRRSVKLAGAEVPNLTAEAMLLMLCMHGCKHYWSRLIWIVDVAMLLDAEPDLEWSWALREAKRLGLWRALSLGVLLAQSVGNAPVPAALLRRFQSDTISVGLARHFEENIFHAPGAGPAWRVPYAVKLLGTRDRLMFLASLGFLRPNERDFGAVALPKPLRALYYLIRPIRLLREKSPR